MDRRSLFRTVSGAMAASLLPLGTMTVQYRKAEAFPVSGRRISTTKGDAGEILYAKLCGDGKTAKVFLDDVEEKLCITADEEQGVVIRPITTAAGNIAFNPATSEILFETVKGRVRIEII